MPAGKNYVVARTVSGVFKIAAWLVFIGGAIAAYEAAHEMQQQISLNGQLLDSGNNGSIRDTVIAILGATILAAASFGFFAYVLDLLGDIAMNTSVRPFGALNMDAPAPPSAPGNLGHNVPAPPAPGWYSDPNGGSFARFWNGQAWTGETQGEPGDGDAHA
jgi:hypothetical protein